MLTKPNSELNESDLPAPDADWKTIVNFALTFMGYEYWGSFEKCAKVSDSVTGRESQATLTELRTRLFMVSGIAAHYDNKPDNLEYVYGLLERMRHRIRNGELD